MIELTKTKLRMADEIVRLQRALAWAWIAIGALTIVTGIACLVAFEIARN